MNKRERTKISSSVLYSQKWFFSEFRCRLKLCTKIIEIISLSFFISYFQKISHLQIDQLEMFSKARITR